MSETKKHGSIVIDARVELHVCSNHFKQFKKESLNLSLSFSRHELTEHHECQIKGCGRHARHALKFLGYIIPYGRGKGK